MALNIRLALDRNIHLTKNHGELRALNIEVVNLGADCVRLRAGDALLEMSPDVDRVLHAWGTRLCARRVRGHWCLSIDAPDDVCIRRAQ